MSGLASRSATATGGTALARANRPHVACGAHGVNLHAVIEPIGDKNAIGTHGHPLWPVEGVVLATFVSKRVYDRPCVHMACAYAMRRGVSTIEKLAVRGIGSDAAQMVTEGDRHILQEL